MTWSLGAAAASVAVALVLTGRLVPVLDRSPTRLVVIGALQGLSPRFALTCLGLALLAALAARAGHAACAWNGRRPGDGNVRLEAQPVPRRSTRQRPTAALLQVDRASVWRSVPLRRGLFVLAVMPGAVAAVAGLEWPDLAIIPGLVAAGAGLLFGVNAFCLDGTGAVWVATLPVDPRHQLLAKARAIAEVCLVGVTIALLAGAARNDSLPTTGEAAALLAGALSSVLVVVSACLRLSVTRPHRAELREPRDTPAPPGAMAVYSARLAAQTTTVGILFSVVARIGDATTALLGLLVVALLCARSLAKTFRLWRDADRRSRCVTTVAHG